MWLIFGALVLVAMVPKEVWIGLGVIGGIALLAYLTIKHLGQKASAPDTPPGHDAHRHEPTLARRPADPPGPPRTAPPEQPLATALGVPVAKLPSQSGEWKAHAKSRSKRTASERKPCKTSFLRRHPERTSS